MTRPSRRNTRFPWSRDHITWISGRSCRVRMQASRQGRQNAEDSSPRYRYEEVREVNQHESSRREPGSNRPSQEAGRGPSVTSLVSADVVRYEGQVGDQNLTYCKSSKARSRPGWGRRRHHFVTSLCRDIAPWDTRHQHITSSNQQSFQVQYRSIHHTLTPSPSSTSWTSCVHRTCYKQQCAPPTAHPPASSP